MLDPRLGLGQRRLHTRTHAARARTGVARPAGLGDLLDHAVSRRFARDSGEYAMRRMPRGLQKASISSAEERVQLGPVRRHGRARIIN